MAVDQPFLRPPVTLFAQSDLVVLYLKGPRLYKSTGGKLAVISFVLKDGSTFYVILMPYLSPESGWMLDGEDGRLSVLQSLFAATGLIRG